MIASLIAIALGLPTVELPFACGQEMTIGGDGDYRMRRAAIPSSIAPQPESIENSSPLPASLPLDRSQDPMIDSNAAYEVNRDQQYQDLASEYEMFDRLGNLVKRVAQVVGPSVMHIEAHKTENSGTKRESYDEAGSGVVLDFGGQNWVLTNRHVIAGAKPQEILLRTADGREFCPTKVLSDPSTDVAVLKVDISGLTPARIGNSDRVNIGDFVVAIGSPFGLSHSVTFGIISAKGRRDLALGEQKIDLQDFFQTDAAINPGNSGGPLLNLRGEVIALNTAIASSSGGSEGIGFAIPINMGMQVAEQLIRYGKLRRGYLGVTLEPQFTVADLQAAGIQGTGGALVKNVRPNSPAAQARLQRGDIIVEFAGHPVQDDDHLVAKVGLTPLGSEIPMIVYRDGRRYTTSVTLVDVETP